MPSQGLGLWLGQTWVTRLGQRPHPGLGGGTAVCRALTIRKAAPSLADLASCKCTEWEEKQNGEGPRSPRRTRMGTLSPKLRLCP